jgi:hypothetical protein
MDLKIIVGLLLIANIILLYLTGDLTKTNKKLKRESELRDDYIININSIIKKYDNALKNERIVNKILEDKLANKK